MLIASAVGPLASPLVYTWLWIAVAFEVKVSIQFGKPVDFGLHFELMTAVNHH